MAYRDDDKEKEDGAVIEEVQSGFLDKDEDEDEVPEILPPEEERGWE